MHINKKSVINYKDIVTKAFIYLIVSMSGFFLLMNKYPYFAIASFLIILILAIIFVLYFKRITSQHAELLGILIIIYLYLILSYFISNQGIGNFLSYQFFRYDGNFFFAYIPFFALAVPYFNYKNAIKFYINILFITFSLFSIFGLYGFVTGNNFMGMIEGTRDRGLMYLALNSAHNATGSVFAAVSIISLVFTLRTKGKKRIYYLIVFLLVLGGLLITKSRGSYIGFATGFTVIMWYYFRSWKKYLIMLASLIIAGVPALYFSGLVNNMPDFFDFTSGTSAVRLNLWDKALYLFSQSPIFGTGFARYNDAGYENIRLVGIKQVFAFFIEPKFDYSSAHAHNSYLHFLAEIGILGLALFLFFWVLCYIKLFKGFKYIRDSFSKNIFISGMGVIAVLFGLSLTEHYFTSPTIIMCLAVFISLAIGLYWQELRLSFIINADIEK